MCRVNTAWDRLDLWFMCVAAVTLAVFPASSHPNASSAEFTSTSSAPMRTVGKYSMIEYMYLETLKSSLNLIQLKISLNSWRTKGKYIQCTA